MFDQLIPAKYLPLCAMTFIDRLDMLLTQILETVVHHPLNPIHAVLYVFVWLADAFDAWGLSSRTSEVLALAAMAISVKFMTSVIPMALSARKTWRFQFSK